MSSKTMSEDDVRAKYISPAVIRAGWPEQMIRRQVFFTNGRIYVKGRLTARGNGNSRITSYIINLISRLPLLRLKTMDIPLATECNRLWIMQEL